MLHFVGFLRDYLWGLGKRAQGDFFSWNSFYARLNNHCETWSYKKLKKEAQKRLNHTGNLFRKNLQSKGSVYRSQFKGNHSIGREFHSLAVRAKKLLI